MTALHQSFGFLMNDIGYFHVVLCRLVEGRGNYLCIHTSLHIGHLLRALVDEQDNHIHLGVVLQDGVSQLFEQHRLTGLRLCHNQSALTFADRRKQVDDTHAERVVITRTEFELLVREQRDEVLKGHTLLGFLRCQTVDTDHFVHREELLRLRVDADRAFYGVARLQAILTHLLLAHVHIVRTTQVVVVGRTQESVSVRRALQRTQRDDVLTQTRYFQ